MTTHARTTKRRATLSTTCLAIAIACDTDPRHAVDTHSAGGAGAGAESGRHSTAGSPTESAGEAAAASSETAGAPSETAGAPSETASAGQAGSGSAEGGAAGASAGSSPGAGQGGDVSTPPTDVGVPATRLASFANSIGVNTHVIYYDGGYADLDAVLEHLSYLGVTHVRDALISANFYDQELYGPWFQRLARAGVRFNLIAKGGSTSKPFDPGAAVAGARFVEGLAAGAVESIEGFNEINNWPVTYWNETSYAAAARAMKALYGAVKADDLLGSLPVYDLTGGEFAEVTVGIANITGRADFANQHPYPQRGEQPSSWIARGFGHYAGDPPKVITEFGYYTDATDTDGWGGVSEEVQAKLTLNGLLDAFAQGVTRTYVYELVDVLPDPESWTHHFGLFRSDHSPKPAATAIHNLTSLIGGTDGDFTPGRLDFELSGLPDTAHHLLFQRQEGTFVLVLWNEPDNWDEVAQKPLATTAVNVGIDLGFGYPSVRIFDPIMGIEPISRHDGERSFVVSLDDHPLLVFVE